MLYIGGHYIIVLQTGSSEHSVLTGFNIFSGYTVRFHPPGQTLEPQHNKFITGKYYLTGDISFQLNVHT